MDIILYYSSIDCRTSTIQSNVNVGNNNVIATHPHPHPHPHTQYIIIHIICHMLMHISLCNGQSQYVMYFHKHPMHISRLIKHAAHVQT